uniref:Metalloendopeptidase n=1 Tax=Rhabditophanes sp. KR3021 TaxID=114890 RepID=A0AC35TKZ0_9BILA
MPDHESHLTNVDFMNAKTLLDSIVPENHINDNEEKANTDSAMYNMARFEGDIVNNGLTSRTIKSFLGEENPTKITGVMRNAVRQTYLKWSDGRIPYTISSQYSSFSRSKIAEAIEEYRKLTCIDFAPKSAADVDYIHIVPDDGCYSLVGRVGGKQPVSLGDGCIQKGIIIHELMHSVGFFHEQSRADRDKYIDIKWENVEAGLQDQFEKYDLKMIDHLETRYDYESVMHYASTAFSKNGKVTIEPKKKGAEIGQRVGFSPLDLYKINKLYNCPQIGKSLFVKPKDAEAVAGRSSGEQVVETTTKKAKKLIKKGGRKVIVETSATKTTDSVEDEEVDKSDNEKDVLENVDEEEETAYSGTLRSRKGPISGGVSGGNISNKSKNIEGGGNESTEAPELAVESGEIIESNESKEKKVSKESKRLSKVKVCEDKRRDCKFLAENEHCESKLSKRFMEENCALSCGICKKAKGSSESGGADEDELGEKAKCSDSREWCEKWADSGMCTQLMFRDYMQEKCPKSCGLC